MSEYSIAIKIAGQLESSYKSAISGAQKGLNTLGGIGKVGAASVSVAGSALMGAGAALAAVGAASVKVGSDFESAMSSVAATAGATDEEYAKLKAAAMEMGRTTSKTATESANALEYMALAGWDVDTSIQALPSVLKMSEASGMDLARCSDLVTDSMSALGVSVDELPNYLDVAAKAQNKSNQSAEQLMEAYLGVGGVMNNLGVPLTESATALGVMANRGIKGSEAGTALNAIMTNLTTGTGKAGEMMSKLGVSAFDSEGNFIGLHETLSQLNTALEGCTEEERNAALAAIGGKTHVDALNDLMMGLNETNADGVSEWDALTAELENANGALNTMRDTKLDNLQGDLATLGSAAEDAGIKIYQNLEGGLRNAAQYGTEQIYRLSSALDEGGLAGLAAEIGPLIADNLALAVAGLPEIISQVGSVAEAFVDGLVANADSIGGSVAEIASAAVQGFMSYYGEFYSTALYLIAGFLRGLESQIGDISNSFGAMIGQLQTAVDDNLDSIIDSAANIVTGLINGLTDNMPQLIAFGVTIVEKLSGGVKEHASEIAGAAIKLLTTIGNEIINNASTLADAGLNIVEGIVNAIADNLPSLLDSADDMVDKISEGLDTALTPGSEFLTRAGEIVGKIGTTLQENMPKLIEVGIKLLGALAKGVLKGAALVVTALPTVLNGIIDTVAAIDWIGLGKQLMNDIIEGIKSLGAAVIEAARTIFEQMMHFGEDTEYTSMDIAGYTQTMDGRYTNDGGENYYTAQELAAQGVAGAAEVAAMYAEAGTAGAEAYSEGLSSGAAEAAAAAQENSQAAFESLKIDQATAEQIGASITGDMAQGVADGQEALAGQVTEAGTQAMQSATDAVQNNADAVTAQIDAMTESLIAEVNEAAASTEGMGSAMDTASAALESGTATVPEAVAAATTSASEAFSTLSTEISATATDVSSIFTDLSAQIASTCSEIGSAVSTLGSETGSATASSMSEVKSNVESAMNSVKQAISNAMSDVSAAVKRGMSEFSSAVQSGCSAAVSAAYSGANGIRSAFSSISLSSTGSNIMQGLINGMEARRAQVIATARSIAQAAANAANAGAQTKSPSRLTTKTGEYLGQGLVIGMDSMRDAVSKAAQMSMINPVIDGTDQVRNFTAQSTNRSGVIGETINGFAGSSVVGSKAQQEAAPTFVFSPTYHFEGEAPSKQDIVEANRMSQAEFEKMMKDYLRKNKRVAFA